MCGNTMPKRKNISNDLNGATVSAHEFGKIYKAISKHSEDHHPTGRMIMHKWTTFAYSFKTSLTRSDKFTPRSGSVRGGQLLAFKEPF